MTLQELQNQALQLPISERWRLVESLLGSIQQETTILTGQHPISQLKMQARLPILIPGLKA